jgi:hypothetical protein
MTKAQRKRIRVRLARALARLDFYCQEPMIKQITAWPSPEFLESLEDDVKSLSATHRVSWKTFRRLDVRITSLRLRRRIDKITSRGSSRFAYGAAAGMGVQCCWHGRFTGGNHYSHSLQCTAIYGASLLGPCVLGSMSFGYALHSICHPAEALERAGMSQMPPNQTLQPTTDRRE